VPILVRLVLKKNGGQPEQALGRSRGGFSKRHLRLYHSKIGDWRESDLPSSSYRVLKPSFLERLCNMTLSK